MIRNQTARNLASRWVTHSPHLERLAVDGEISHEVLEAAGAVMDILHSIHIKKPTKASRVEAQKARLLTEYLARHVRPTIKTHK